MRQSLLEENIPSGVGLHLMQLRPTLLAIVLLWHLGVFQYSDTASVLPYAAAITRDEQSSRIFCVWVDIVEGFTQRWTWVLLLAANASSYLFLFGVNDCFVLAVDVVFQNLGFFGQLRPLRAARWFTSFFAGL